MATHGERIGRFWAGYRDTGQAYYPLVMVDSGHDTWAQPFDRRVSHRAIFTRMFNSARGRRSTLDMDAEWAHVGELNARVAVTVTNRGPIDYRVDRGLTLTLLVFEATILDEHIVTVRDVVARSFEGNLGPGETAHMELDLVLPEDVNAREAGIVALVEHHPDALSNAYDMLQAVVAVPNHPPLPTATVTPTPTPVSTPTPRATPPWEWLADGQSAGNPFYVTNFFSQGSPRMPAVFAFNDTVQPRYPNTVTHALALASQVGNVFGMAWDGPRRHLYAASFAFGTEPPLDPDYGTVYRIDLARDTVARWAAVPGATRSIYSGAYRVGLGDIDIGHEGDQTVLFAVNLLDRRIHRLSVPEGRHLGAFDNGAAGESWAQSARPFGLGFRDGWLYHGVVYSAEVPDSATPFEGVIYRSRPDGSEMTEAARFELSYPRSRPWIPWDDGINQERLARNPQGQPVITDIEFRPNGDLVIGLRDRLHQVLLNSLWQPPPNGDTLPTEKIGPGRWRVITNTDYYDDRQGTEESNLGSLAALPGQDFIVTGYCGEGAESGGLWLNNVTGNVDGPVDGAEEFGETGVVGDVEALWLNLPPTPTPSPSATATSIHSPTPTATPTLIVALSPTPIVTPTAPPSPIYLPWLANVPCQPRTKHADVALVFDLSTSMQRQTDGGRTKLAAAQEAAGVFVQLMDFEPDTLDQNDRVSIVGFNSRAWVALPLSSSRGELTAAIAALSDDVATGSRLDLAVEVGAGSLLAGQPGDNTPVLVVLADGVVAGVPTPAAGGSPDDSVRAAADAAKARGVRLYAIGLGRPNAPDPADRVNAPLLRSIASGTETYYETPDAESLAQIYRAIVKTLLCP